jgi:hypothetical protein
MIVLFIIVGDLVLKCIGARYCEDFSPVLLTKMWEFGLVELMFESTGVIRIYRKTKDKITKEELKERMDKRFDE